VTARVIIKSIFCPQRLIRGPRKSCITFHHYIYMFVFPKIIIISGIFLYNDRRGLTGKVHTCQEGGGYLFCRSRSQKRKLNDKSRKRQLSFFITILVFMLCLPCTCHCHFKSLVNPTNGLPLGCICIYIYITDMH
jgi:hypothetical protein